jgi:release factor glutamine methyltransferase
MFADRSVYTLIRTAEAFLKSKGLSDPKSDAEVLLSFILQVKRSKLVLIRDRILTNKQVLKYKKCVLRRSRREPAAYIIKSVEFMGFEFKVDKSVLIPRPETEILVEAALALRSKEKKNKDSVLDLCTGSGCIAISLSRLGNFEKIIASDISNYALKTAKYNARVNEVFNIDFVESNIFNRINNKKVNMIISNPPYVSDYEYVALEPEIKYEPRIALVAGDDGLFFYKEIADKSDKYLKDTGFIFLELNANKVDEIKKIFLDSNYKDISVISDYSGFSRILKIKSKCPK